MATRGEGKERRDEKLAGGKIRRRGGQAAESPLPREDGAPAAACSLASVLKRRSLAAHLWMASRGKVLCQVDPIGPLGQQVSALNGPFLI